METTKNNQNVAGMSSMAMHSDVQISRRTKAAIELYRRAYMVFGDVLEFIAVFQQEDEEGKMEAEFHDLEESANGLTMLIQHIVGASAVLDQESILENVKSDLLSGINNQ